MAAAAALAAAEAPLLCRIRRWKMDHFRFGFHSRRQVVQAAFSSSVMAMMRSRHASRNKFVAQFLECVDLPNQEAWTSCNVLPAAGVELSAVPQLLPHSHGPHQLNGLQSAADSQISTVNGIRSVLRASSWTSADVTRSATFHYDAVTHKLADHVHGGLASGWHRT